MYLFILSLFILILGLIFLIIGLKKERQDLKLLEDKTQRRIKSDIQNLQAQKEQLTTSCNYLFQQEESERKHLEEIKQQTRDALLSGRQQVESEVELRKQVLMKDVEQQYAKKQEELETNFQTLTTAIGKEITEYKQSLYNFKSMQEAINNAIRRKKEIEEQESFYMIDIPENDREDIVVLQSMDKHLNNRDVIPKLIWELFIKRPTQEMIKRVVGPQKTSGIYKITYKNTGEAYIGKTTDFATRWQNHIKTAIGLEGAARTTLHNRMARDGIWNYTFEIVEQVDKDHLAQRESYYIDLYGTKGQLNMKSGDKQ